MVRHGSIMVLCTERILGIPSGWRALLDSEGSWGSYLLPGRRGKSDLRQWTLWQRTRHATGVPRDEHIPYTVSCPTIIIVQGVSRHPATNATFFFVVNVNRKLLSLFVRGGWPQWTNRRFAREKEQKTTV